MNSVLLLHVLKPDQICSKTSLIAACPILSQTGVSPADSSSFYPSPSEQQSDCLHMLMGILVSPQITLSFWTVAAGKYTAVRELNEWQKLNTSFLGQSLKDLPQKHLRQHFQKFDVHVTVHRRQWKVQNRPDATKYAVLLPQHVSGTNMPIIRSTISE
jgi:hypothetical protein